MLAIIDWIELRGLEGEVYAAAGLSGLRVSDRPLSASADHVLYVRTHGPELVYFEYAKYAGSSHTLKKTVRYEEAVECFRLILAYKFGLHRPPEAVAPPQASPRSP